MLNGWVIVKVKQGDTVVEKSAQEFIEGSTDIAPFLPALKTSNQGIQVHGSSGASQTNADPFAAAREFGKQHNEAAKQGGSLLHERFGIQKSA